MTTIASLLEEHSIATNNITVEYLLKFKSSHETPDKFQQQILAHFKEKVVEAGTDILRKLVSDDIEIESGHSHYELVAGIKKINKNAVDNLMAALIKITNQSG